MHVKNRSSAHVILNGVSSGKHQYDRDSKYNAYNVNVVTGIIKLKMANRYSLF